MDENGMTSNAALNISSQKEDSGGLCAATWASLGGYNVDGEMPCGTWFKIPDSLISRHCSSSDISMG